MQQPSEDIIDKFRDGGHSAFIVGYTGETGKALTRDLLERKIFSRLVLIGRRHVNYEDPLYSSVEQIVVDFDNLDNFAESFKDIRTGFCCLGTTRGKAGKDGFYKVDHDYVVNAGKVALAAGCQDFHVVTVAGADKNSSLLYNRAKGEVEEELKELGLNRLVIYQSGLIMVDREECRPAEWCIICCCRPFAFCCPSKMGTTPVETLATAMANAATLPLDTEVKIYTLDNRDIHRVAG